MKLSLESFNSLNERERRMVLFGGLGAVLLFVIAVVLPLERGVSHARERIERKQSDLAWMHEVAPELQAAGPAAQRGSSQGSLIAIVDRAAHEAGLASALTSSEPNGPNGLRVRLDKAPFDNVMGWLARLADREGVRVEAATIDSAGAPGLVNAGIVLRSQ